MNTKYHVLKGEAHLQPKVDEVRASLEVKQALIEGMRKDRQA